MCLLMRSLAVLALLLLPPVLAGAGEAFLTAIEDVPLAPGLAEQATGGMVFDSPMGRIVEAVANGTVPADEISHFYTQTLPQLGWNDAGKMTFKRDNETLRISVEPAQKGVVTVRFNLTPHP